MKILKYGSTGPNTRLLQLALNRAQNARLDTDGVFGERTRNELIRFQAENGLSADGIAGPQTQAALRPWYTGVYMHRVRQGDTLWSISRMHGVSLERIVAANPGIDLVTGALNEGEYFDAARRIAARYPSIPFPSGWKADIRGIDLNLQYPAGWETARDNKFALGFVSPAPADYVGSAPLVAPESRAMYDFTMSVSPALTLSYHSQGRVIYRKYADYEPPRSRQIAEAFAAVSGYSVEDTPYASGFAGYKDRFIQSFNRPGYTIEVGLGTNPLPLSRFDGIYSENLGILTYAALATL